MVAVRRNPLSVNRNSEVFLFCYQRYFSFSLWQHSTKRSHRRHC